jgi:succinoglycan biosynthesis transport protein ExoP
MRHDFHDRLLTGSAAGVPRQYDDAAAVPDWPAAGAPGKSPGFSMRVVRRHLWLIVSMLVCLNLMAAIAMVKLPSRYTAEASVLIAPREPNVMDVKAVIAGLSSDNSVLESEIQVLRSRRLARNVVIAEQLDRNPEFNPALAPPGIQDWIATRWQQFVALLPAALRPAESPPLTEEARERAAAAHDPLDDPTDSLLRHLTVSAIGRSRVIGIAITSADAVVAANVANRLAELYIDQQLQAKIDATSHAHEWLEQRVADLHKQVIAADTAVETYRQSAGLLQGRTSSLTGEETSELSRQIILAEVQRANADARWQTVMAALKSQNNLYALPEVQSSQVIRDLRQQESTLTQTATALTMNFKSDYPKLALVRAQLDAVNQRVRAEVGRIAASLQDEAQISSAREHFLEATLAALRARVSVSNEGEIQLRSLQHEADADRTLYDHLLTREKETKVESGLQQPDAEIISRAEPPVKPSFPNPLIMLPACFVASCLMTALLVLVMESLDHSFSSLEQVEDTLGVPAFGATPLLPRRWGRRRVPETYVLTEANSVYSEALRSLYNNLLLSGIGERPKVLLFTSAVPGEGKTSIVLSLARLMAANGKRVVVVDCDTRRPMLHNLMRLTRGPGLTDCLREGLDVSALLQQDPMSPAWLLSAGQDGQVSPGLFASESMETLIHELSARFDMVLLDSGPVLLVSETRALGQLADKTVLVVRWQSTRREHVFTALRQLAQTRCFVAGLLLSMARTGSYSSNGEDGLLRRHVRLYLAR